MKSIRKYSILLTTALTALFLGACTDEYSYDAAKVEGSQVYFSNELSSSIEASKEASSVSLPLCRVATDGDLTVNLTSACDNSAWNVPSSVTFQDGDSVADIVITYNPDAVEYGVLDSIHLSITDASYTTPYGLSSYDGVIGVPEPWSEAVPFNEEGTCTYTYSQMFTGVDEGLQFLVRSSSLTGKQQFLIPNWCYGVTLTLDYDPETGEISVAPQNTGYYATNYSSYVYIADYKHYYELRGRDNSNVATCSFDTEQGIITIPVFYYLAEGPSQYGYFGAGEEVITLDGYNRKDVSIDVTYTGRFFDTKSNPYICGNITLGADVTSANVALVPESEMGEDTWATTRAAVIDGSYSNLQTIEASGEVRFDATELADGTYYIVAFSFLNDEAQELGYAEVKYTASSDKETFTDLYKGTYTYTLFFGSTDEPYTDEGLILSQSDKDENKYKIGSWGYGVDFIFSFNEDGTITVADCETGYEHASYGMVMVGDLVTYTGSTERGQSYYDSETGTFYFAVVYYVSDGVFNYGYETYQITDQAVKARIDAAQRKAMSKKHMKVANKKLMPQTLCLHKSLKSGSFILK